jgi:energy-coupling factor transport system permease protein
MQDARLRLLTVIILSVASFMSVAGALAAFIWWIIFTPGIRTIAKSPFALFFLGFTASVSAVIWLTGGDGISYLVRMAVILLLAFYAYTDRAPGDFLDLSVWLFGKKIGFDIGLAAEMSLQGMEVLSDEARRTRVAFRLKAIKFGFRSIAPSAGLMIYSQFARAEEQADLLAVRGYRGGGMVCPQFTRVKGDVIASTSAILPLIFAIMPVGDIFILLQ